MVKLLKNNTQRNPSTFVIFPLGPALSTFFGGGWGRIISTFAQAPAQHCVTGSLSSTGGEGGGEGRGLGGGGMITFAVTGTLQYSLLLGRVGMISTPAQLLQPSLLFNRISKKHCSIGKGLGGHDKHTAQLLQPTIAWFWGG